MRPSRLGEYGTIAVGSTRRKLSFFVMVVCYSRQMYLQLTVSQTMEHFLACHQNAFAVLGVPEKIMVDNLKSAVLKRLIGEVPVLNPRYVDFARHRDFKSARCNVRAGNEKGRVESGVGYVKKNFLNGLELADFAHVNPAAQVWLAEIANVRIHGETHRRPLDLFAEERAHLKPANVNPYDLARVLTLRASSQFRILLHTDRYSVPASHAGRLVTVKVYPDRLCIDYQDKLIARYGRSFEAPGHRGPRSSEGLARTTPQRPRAAAPLAVPCPDGQCSRLLRGTGGAALQRPFARAQDLAEIYGKPATVRAIEDALVFNAFSSEYIGHLVESRPLQT